MNLKKTRDFENSYDFENGMKFENWHDFENRVNLKKVPFAAYPIAPTRIVKMKLVKTLGFKDFDLAPTL